MTKMKFDDGLRRLVLKLIDRVTVHESVAAVLCSLAEVKARLADQETFVAQLRDCLRQAGGLIPPPPHLQIRVSGVYHPDFIRHGEALLSQLKKSLEAVCADITTFGSVLDFGCGCGRISRAFHLHRNTTQQLHATDIDGEAIAWCRDNYGAVANFATNASMPPMAYTNHMFDLIYSVSIFTHLPEEMQFAWLGELRRVIRTGGYLLLTTHGHKHIQELPAIKRKMALQHGFYYAHAGDTEGLPGFYQVAYHTPDYVRRRWSEFFDIVDVQECGLDNHQDIVVCRAV